MAFIARLRRKLPGHLDAVIAFLVFAAMVAMTLGVRAWEKAEQSVFDELTARTAKGAITQPISIVAISEEAFEALKLQWPWPRKVHADLVSRIARGGAAVIALDIVFAEPTDQDPEFARAVATAKPVVMAADFQYRETGAVKLWTRVDPVPALVEAGALPGFASVPFDADQVVRRIPPEPDAFWRQVVKVLQVRAPSLGLPRLPEEGALIRYPGPEDKVFDPIPYHLVLEASDAELKQAFEGRIVLVGRDLRSGTDIQMAAADMFTSPFGQLAGVKIHATLVENALTGSWIQPLGRTGRIVAIGLASLFAFVAFRRWHPLSGLAFLGGGMLIVAAIAWYAFDNERLFIPAAAPAATLVLGYLAYGGRSYLVESERKREIQRAFSLYLSPELVDRIAQDPSKLSLGGESREITVMFTDLAGFTKLTEKNPPEVVTQVLIAHFNAMTAVIQEQRGTVVQFIGDAIMAFWNAPLDDPDHAVHAVRAAVGMQAAMETLRAELRAKGQPELHMRIGVNTCTAVVGNMGSSTRFYYTALGDGINLAARLEGANKAYGTGILVSAETASRLGGAFSMRRIDRVKVSGKTQAVDVFTPVPEAALAQSTEAAFDAYLRRDWGLAERLYGEMVVAREDDLVARRLLERVDAWKRDASLVTEDGSVALDKL